MNYQLYSMKVPNVNVEPSIFCIYLLIFTIISCIHTKDNILHHANSIDYEYVKLLTC